MLVTGATGWIGRALHERATIEQRSIVTIGGTAGAATGGQAVDLRREGSLAAAAGDGPLGCVVHLAARIPRDAREADDLDLARDNLAIDLEVAGFARARGLGLVYVSSSAVYGPGSGRPPWHEDRARPCQAYAAAKRAGEELALALRPEALVLRISAPYGPGDPRDGVMARFIGAARRDETLAVYGRGTRSQHFTHLDDIVLALLRAEQAARQGGAGGIYNVAGPEPVTMRALAERVVKATPGSRSQVEVGGHPDPEEGRVAQLCTDRIAQVLGWRAEVGLEEGLARLTQGEVS